MFPHLHLSFINFRGPSEGHTVLGQSSSSDPPVKDDDSDTVKVRPASGRKIGKTSMYLNHRAIIDSSSIVEVIGVTPWPLEQPTFLTGFKPWQLATIAALATAAWAAPVGLLVLFLG